MNRQTKIKLKRIKLLFEEIDKLFNELSDIDQEKIFEYHAENYSLNHCVRWGLQTAEELTR
jgi:hypothetical protein